MIDSLFKGLRFNYWLCKSDIRVHIVSQEDQHLQRSHMICALPFAAARNALRTAPLRCSNRTQKRTMVAGMSASWGYKDMPSQEGKTFIVTVRSNCCVLRGMRVLAPTPWLAIGDSAVAGFVWRPHDQQRTDATRLSLCAAVA